MYPCMALMIVLSVLGPGNGVVAWKFSTDSMPGSPTLYPDARQPRGVAICAGNAVILLDGSGREQWRAAFDQPVSSSATAADIDGDGAAEVLAPLMDGRVACLDAQGKTRWITAFDTRADGFCGVVAADIHPAPGLELVAGFSDGWIHCLGADGAPLWRFYGDKFRTGPPAVGDADGDGAAEIVYGTDNGNIYCLDGFGEVKWRYSELAPYGRSGVNLADLKGDGNAEVLITRSNTGNATCLMALEGKTGAFQWRTHDFMQSYCSTATADLDGDGVLEILHGDKGNWLYCTNADGTERVRTELKARGIFWAPAVGDVDGDGAQDILVCVRGKDARFDTFAFRVLPDMEIIEPIALDGSGNAAPAIGDIDGDGALEAVFATENPPGIQVVRWGGAGRVDWPSLRGDSALTARGNVPPGGPAAAPALTRMAAARLTIDPVFLGTNTLRAEWEHAAPKDAFASVSVRSGGKEAEIRTAPLAEGALSAELSFDVVYPEPAEIVVRVMASGQSELAGARMPVTPQPAETYDQEGVKTAVDNACAAGAKAGADTGGLLLQHQALLAACEAIRRGAGGDARAMAQRATALRRDAEELIRFARLLEQRWVAGDAGSFVCWQDMNPWDTFDPKATPGHANISADVRVPMYQDEYEDIALNLLNCSAESMNVRFVFAKPNLNGRAEAEPPLAKHVTLRRGLRVPAHKEGMVLDALPELDLSRTITLAPGEIAQLWLVADSYGLEPGEHALTLYAGSLEQHMTLREIPIVLEVRPIALPIGVYAQMNWAGVDIDQSSPQQLEDMIAHGISVAYGPVLPVVTLDAEGNVAGAVDWTHADAGFDRTPAYFQLLFSGPPPVKWPEGVSPAEDSALYEKGFAAAIRVLADHLREKGFGYERWAFYPMDEPWLTGFTNIPALRKFCERVKRVDAKVRNYADPTGLLRVEYVQEFKDLIDVWQPEMNILKRDPALTKWFRENAQAFWAYEATDPGKNLLPLGYYRGYAWLAWMLGLDGAGFWCYKDFDGYWPLETTQWAVVYPTGDEVTPARRWEAVRDGQEDYRLMYALREEIKRVAALGRGADAEQAQDLLDKAVEEVIGWQARTIDEITRQTRDYELNYDLLLRYRARIGEEILRLREIK